MGRGYTHADFVGRESQSAQRGRDFRPIFRYRVRRRLSLIIRVQHSDDDKTALIASASLASDHVRLLGPGEEGVSPI